MQDKIEPLANSCERVMIVAHGALNKGIMSYIKNTKSKISGRRITAKLQRDDCRLYRRKYRIVDETKLFYTLQE